ncbi:MAG: PIG-L family deacetylase [Bdellovibrionales bacterium]
MKKHNLIVVAHPDDETIFFGGLIQTYRRRPWKIICVTDGNADGKGPQRHLEFVAACKKLGSQVAEMWNFPDKYDARVDVEKLADRLAQENAGEVFTHGILGEYGHPHHQDVSLAAHRAFHKTCKVWSVAYNCFAEKVVKIPRKAYQLKCEILSQVYFQETNRFARWLPSYNHEGYVQLALPEVEALYKFLSRGQKPEPGLLKTYRWFAPYLEEFRSQVTARPF